MILFRLLTKRAVPHIGGIKTFFHRGELLSVVTSRGAAWTYVILFICPKQAGALGLSNEKSFHETRHPLGNCADPRDNPSVANHSRTFNYNYNIIITTLQLSLDVCHFTRYARLDNNTTHIVLRRFHVNSIYNLFFDIVVASRTMFFKRNSRVSILRIAVENARNSRSLRRSTFLTLFLELPE